MNITLNNKLSKEFFITSIAGGTPNPNWEKLPANAQAQLTLTNNRLLVFKIPHGEDFRIKSLNRTLFEFIQAKIQDPNNDNMDTYVFRVTNFGSVESGVKESGGDADIEPPPSGIPVD